jgi:hypothetical protein
MIRFNTGIFFAAVHRHDQKTKTGSENERQHAGEPEEQAFVISFFGAGFFWHGEIIFQLQNI